MHFKRVSNWPRKLSDFVEARRHTPFKWGGHDCCTFAADCVFVVYGVDPMADLRGYEDAKAAMRIIGGPDKLPDFAGAQMQAAGFREIDAAHAGQGDPVCVMLEHPTCGIHLGNVIAAPGKDGLEFLPPDKIIKAWRAE